MMLAALLLVAAPPLESPKAFMAGIYSHYRSSNFSPFTHPERYFAPRLLAAINEDSRLAHGEVGYLDGDPICQCQDSSGMRPTITSVTRTSRSKAVVHVSIAWPGDKARPVRFSLADTSRGWRIADVSSADEPSLLAALESSNRKARKHK
jgi:hypothetical protein